MSVKKYKFVSPGIFVSEIDESGLPKTPNPIGPVVIGRAERGPSMKPVTVDSFSEFVETFGNPVPGGQGGDVWRDGNYTSPMYGTYAAQAWLKNSSPLTYVRLLGCQHQNAITAGEAGWITKDSSGTATIVGPTDANGGAYGLFIIDSSSYASKYTGAGMGPDMHPCTGTLAAIWYLNQGSITLSGSYPLEGAPILTSGLVSGSAILIQSVGAYKEFRAQIRDKEGNIVKTTTFNFNKDSSKYIRKVFNTNPTLTNTAISQGANTASYWLGSTFERQLDAYVLSGSTAGDCFGIILGVANTSYEGSDFKGIPSQPAKTGWYFSQDLQSVTGAANSFQPEKMTKLFRFVCLDTGEWTQSNIKISIQDLRASTNPFDLYGTFSVVLRKVDDKDNAIRVVERFSNCNLNPNSSDYIAKKIGDRYKEWDDAERRYREYGNYDNSSKFVRVEMNADVDAGATNAEFLPFGMYGPARFKGFAVMTGSTVISTFGASIPSSFANAWVKGGTDIARAYTLGTQKINTGNLIFTGSFVWPAIAIRSASSEGDLANPKDAYWGIQTTVSRTSTRIDYGYKDLVRLLPADIDPYSADNDMTEYSWIFTLDDIYRPTAATTHAAHISGSRASGLSITAQSTDNYKAVLDAGFDRFTSPLFGGFDGVDITEKDPFNNTDMASATETTNYAFNSVKRAIDCLADPEVAEFNIMVMPGLTHEGLTSHLINVCEDRADALGIIDLEGGYVPSSENNLGDSSTSNRGDVDTCIASLNDRGLNSSYGCSYYPWVQVKDTINGSTLWVPPSIAALGTMASSEAKSELWFAPAGFNRGGLTEGSAGIPVVGVKEKLTVKQRDKLYSANVNPIASFPSEGIVIFGQKTLQVTPSALDRINVRRMMIYIKKEVSRMASTILFDQNIKVTWNRFLGKVNPFLRSIKTRFGLVDFKVVLDETTTTPDLIDRNIMYAKIYLKPAKAIEFIALDFFITSTGASFED